MRKSGESIRSQDPPAERGAGEFDRLLEQVYDELRHIAHFHNLNERHNLTLQTTALVHEAYVRLVKSEKSPQPQDSRHLKALTSRIIRRLLVDQARQRNALKRTPDNPDEDPLGRTVIDPGFEIDLLDLDAALTALSRGSQRLAQIVEMRFFGGFSTEQTADALGLSTRTVERDWQKARAYLLQLLEPVHPASDRPD